MIFAALLTLAAAAQDRAVDCDNAMAQPDLSERLRLSGI
jgi:hypothetical protein